MNTSAPKKSRRRLILIILAAYLITSGVFSWYAVRKFRLEFAKAVSSLGKGYIEQTETLRKDVKGITDPELRAEMRPYDSLLTFLPPFGHMAKSRCDHIEDTLIFVSENLAKPEAQRFADPETARSFSFDPAAKTDSEITAALMKGLGGE